MDKKKFVKDWCSLHSFDFIELKNYDNVYDLLKNNIINIDIDNVNSNLIIELMYYGNYYKVIKNYKKMIYYYEMVIKIGDNIHIESNIGYILSIINLGKYYQYCEYNYENMKKYYKLILDIYNYDYICSINQTDIYKCYINYIFSEYDFTIDYDIIRKLTEYDNDFINKYLQYLLVFDEQLFTDNYKYLNKINKHKYYLYKNNLKETFPKECHICKKYKYNIKLYNCSYKHRLCLQCLIKLEKCPFCNEPI
jgi:hypothetical protein